VGGTIARHVRSGDEVHIAILCEGASVRYGSERLAEVNAQAHQAAAVLGVAGLSIFDLPDQRLDTLPISEVAAPVEGLLSEFDPEILYTHFGGDVNRDHQLVAEATAVAARPFPAPRVSEILMFESASISWGTTHFTHPPFDPKLFVDITETLDVKLRAMEAYVTEAMAFPHPRSIEALRDQARYWGSRINRPAAEAFVPMRIVR
jgi:LmbE family N-acetylglucosaminyl deacetylase